MSNPENDAINLQEKINQVNKKNHQLAEKTRHLEQELKKKDELNDLFTDLTTNMPGAIFQFQVMDDGSYRILYMSKSAEKIFEQPLSAILNFDLILESVFEDDKELYLSSIAEATSQNKPWSHDYRILTTSGKIKWLHGTSNPKQMEDGNYIWNGVLTDITKERNIKEFLAVNDERYRKAQQIGKVGNWEYDIQTDHFWGSEEAKNIYGFAPDSTQFTPEEVEKCIPDRERVHQALIDLIEFEKEYDLEFQIMPINSEHPKIISSKAELIKDFHGNPVKVVGVIQDITKEYHTEQKLIKALKEKETLLHEIHHRVKNNLQVINSLFALQANNNENEQIKEILKDSQSKVYAISAVHETLHGTENLAEIDLKNYLSKVITSIFQTYATDPKRVKLKNDIENSPISINQAYPLGLIINELISNSLKHAFPDERAGEISITMQNLNKEHELIIMDNGIGISEDVDWKNTKSLGLKLVRVLVESQLEGSVEMENRNGTRFTIKFNNET